jgi:altronate dehydratase large subunit
MTGFLGFRRADGRIGVRNHVLIMSVIDVVNPLVRRIASLVQGTVPIPTALGRAHDGAMTARYDTTFAGLIDNPNVAGAVVLGFEPGVVDRLVERAATSGKPIHGLAVLRDGSTSDLLHRAAALARDMVGGAGRSGRSEASLADLVLGLKCGGSDPTSGLVGNPTTGIVSDRIVAAGGTVILTETEDMLGAEHLLARRAASPEIGDALIAAVRRIEEQAAAVGKPLSALHEDHIAAGLTTNEEKALGAIRKAGTSPLQQVISYGERPAARGLVFMDAMGGGIPELTGLAAAGAQLLLFVTGTGHPTGNPVAPTLKVTGNPRTGERFSASIDVDLGAGLEGTLSLEDGADRLMSALLAAANGGLTRGEILGDVEVAVTPPDAWRQHLV